MTDYANGVLMGLVLAIPVYLFLDQWIIPWIWDELRSKPPRSQNHRGR